MGKIALLAAALASPAAHAMPLVAVTPSGRPEVVFHVGSEEEARGKIASKCMDKGFAVVSNAGGGIVCEIPMSAGDQALTAFFTGTRYGTPPKQMLRINVADTGEKVRAQATMWTETQTAYGQNRQTPLDSDDSSNAMMAFLREAGGEFVPGTSFPYYVYVGVNGSMGSMDGKNWYYRVDAIEPESPAAEAGIQPGDRILRINGQTFKDDAGWFKRLGRPYERQANTMEIKRGDSILNVSVLSKARAPVPQ